jgi:hypothetical protein
MVRLHYSNRVANLNGSAFNNFSAQAAMSEHGSDAPLTQSLLHARTGMAQLGRFKHRLTHAKALTSQGIEIDA